MTPTEHFGRQVRAYRRRRDWTQPELAERCRAAGLEWDRSIVANVEGGRRSSATIHELLTLARVLSVPPALLIFPVESEEAVEVGPGCTLRPGPAIRWLVGDDPSGALDQTAYKREARSATAHLTF